MMRDPITDAAQDPSCLLCLTPDRGGSWWSRLRPAQLRNFADNPMTFTDSYTAQDGIGTDDFTLSVDFTLLRENVPGIIYIGCMQCIYYSSTKGYQPCVRILKSDGTKDALYPVGTSHILENVASIKVIKTGQNVRMVVHARDGSTVKDQTKPLPDGATVTFLSGATTYPGNIFAASIRNDTTGTAVWQAAYSDLNDTSNPWPSPVPRNFAEEPEAWRDEETTAPSIGEDDCEFFIRYRLDGYPEGSAISQIFYHNSQNGSINIAFAGDGTGGNYSVIRLTDVGAFMIPLDRIRQLGEHTIRIQRVGLFVTVEFDGEVVATSSAGTKKIAVYSTTAPVSDFDGVIFETYWKSLTSGRTVWSYPSEAERVRLITKTNVRTDRGAFEAADENISAGVVTQLDLRGNTTSKTFWARGYFPKHANTGVLYIYPLIGQGDIILGTDAWVFRVTAWEDNRTTSGAINLRCDFCDADNVARMCRLPITDDFFNATHDIAYVIDFQANGAFCSVYIDGLVAVQKNFTASAFGAGATSAMSANVGIRQDPIHSYPSGNSVECALVFDRALSAAEIAALTPKQA